MKDLNLSRMLLILYIIIAIVTIGSLPFQKIATAEDDELPHHCLAKLWNQPIGYTTNTTGVIISISIIGVCFLAELIYKKTERNNV